VVVVFNNAKVLMIFGKLPLMAVEKKHALRLITGHFWKPKHL